VLNTPEMKAAFLYDLSTALEGGLRAPITDLVLFARDWGFSLRDIRVPVRFWHGDADGIVPLSHGEFMAALVPGADLVIAPGGGHFAGYVVAEDVLDWIVEQWPDRQRARPMHAVKSGPSE
jgi:pimeloyl-ACP methyl ester carboxylesterase